MASLARRGEAALSGRPNVLLKAAIAGLVLLVLVLATIAVEMFLLVMQLRQLGASVPSSGPTVTRLDAIRSDLDRMQPDLHQMSAGLSQVQGNTSSLDPSLRDLVSKIAALDTDLAQIKAVLADVDQHVQNLDRKTGPAPPVRLP